MSILRLLLVSVFVSFFGIACEGALRAIGLPLALVPELVLLFVLLLSFYEASPYGAFLAFLCGLIVDISGGQLIGPWAGSYVLCFGMIPLISDRIFIESGLSLMFVATGLTLLSQVLYMFISVDPMSQLFSDWAVLLGKAFTTAFVAPLFFPFMRRVLRYSSVEASRRNNSRAYS